MGLFDNTDWGALASGFATPQVPGVPVPPPLVPGPNMSPISPAFLASSAAAQGIPPPPVDIAPNTNVGAALTGSTVPVPQPRPVVPPLDIQSDAQKAEAPAAAMNANASADKTKPNDLASVLKGVTMPKPPELQKVGTPAAPKATAVKGGDLLALYLALNAAPGAGAQKLPSTLGQAFGRG